MRGVELRALHISTAVVLALTVCVAVAWYSGERPPVDEVAKAERALGMKLATRRIEVSDVTLHVVSAGPADGPPVLLLHGFPEFWYSWRHQLAALARAGFRVLVPDLRGYNRSDKPSDPNVYSPDHFVADALGLLDALQVEQAFVAGHDVGGGTTWRLALMHPERVRKAVIFNAAHPLASSQARPQDDADTVSWFRAFFRLPWLPELVARSGGWWLLSKNLRDTSRPGTFGDPVLDVYKSAWNRGNAISTMINSYRAPFVAVPDSAVLEVPVRVVWGANDAFFSARAASLTSEIVGAEAFVEISDATHWILLEEPERTSWEMIDFFSEG
jgi:pimeloyl-ACP methyl ester carboxylesterase